MEGVVGRGDNARMRRTGRSALARGIAALAVMAAGIVVVATRGTSPVTSAQTVLGAVKNARIVSPTGAIRLAAAGDRLLAGEVVVTGHGGSAELITRHRRTLLGGLAALAVVNGGRQQLRTGTAVVDSLDGPGLALDLSGDVVTIPRGSATEAARGPSTRVGALAGPATITSTSGRRLALPSLSQAVLSGDALPAGATPLQLTDSVNEDSVVPSLVRDDIALNALARGIDTTGRSTARVVEASWTGTTQPVPNSASRSERVLPVLIADSTHGGTAQQRYDDAIAWRTAGGSWGVVLHLLSGHATAVETTLADMQRRGQMPGQIGSVLPSGATVAATGSGTNVFVNPPADNGSAPRHHRHATRKPTSRGTPPPPPPDTVLGGLVATVQSVITSVFGILPHDPVSGSDSTKVTTRSSRSTSTTATTQRSAAQPPTAQPATSTTSKVAKPATKTVTKQVATVTPVASATPSTGLLGSVLGGLLGKH
jgi:hypothetical protein